jgi:phosphohistidine phosphatase
MDIYILRHGIAVARNQKRYKNDADRPLTEEGIDKMRKIARALKNADLRLDLLLSSPWVRARQTADIVAEALGEKVRLTELLTPEASAADLINELNTAAPKRVMLVGHEPALSRLISVLTTGNGDARIELKKGGLCKLTSEELSFSRSATLNWLMTPRQIRAGG